MTLSITAALLAGGILGLAFNSTRGISIAAFCALTFIHPSLAILAIAGAGVAIYLKHFH